MVHVSDDVMIRRPLAVVFRWVSDPDLARRWQPDVVAGRVLEETADVVGTEFVETLSGRGGTAEMRGRITEYKADEAMTFELRGPGVDVVARYSVDGSPWGTRLHADIDIQPESPPPKVFEPFIRRRVARQLRRELETLQRLCETRAA